MALFAVLEKKIGEKVPGAQSTVFLLFPNICGS
jgi:hypothetical protein